MSNKKILYSIIAIVSITILAFVGIKQYKFYEKEKKLEARFDKFMVYYYPYLDDIAHAANIYTRQQVSLMYDYMTNQRGRYIHENVGYYDGDGYFSMRENFNIMVFLQQSQIYYFCRASGPVGNGAPRSRYEERNEFERVFQSARSLEHFNIYVDDINYYGRADKIKAILDSLNFEIQSGLHNLRKYRNSGPKIDFNLISDADYDLKNY